MTFRQKRKKSKFWEKDRNLWSTVCSICVKDKDRYILADSTTKKEAKKVVLLDTENKFPWWMTFAWDSFFLQNWLAYWSLVIGASYEADCAMAIDLGTFSRPVEN